MRRTTLLYILISCSAPALAQYQPDIGVTLTLSEKRPHLAIQQVAVANCYTNDLSGAQREELAVIKVTVRGSWERSAQHLAAEKAAELGANCLHSLFSYGKDNEEYPVQRHYKAFRVTVPYGPWRVPASPESLVPASAAGPSQSGFSMPPLKIRSLEKKHIEAHGGHLSRAMGAAVYFHEVILDPARTKPEMREDVTRDIEEYFGESELRKFNRAIMGEKMIRIDLRTGAVSAPQ